MSGHIHSCILIIFSAVTSKSLESFLINNSHSPKPFIVQRKLLASCPLIYEDGKQYLY